MIALCREAGLPEPDFELRQGFFVLTLWRDWLTEEVLSGLELSDRQRLAIRQAKTVGYIGNRSYRELTGASGRTALRELRHLVEVGLLEKVGTTGRSARYVLTRAKPAGNPSNPPGGGS